MREARSGTRLTDGTLLTLVVLEGFIEGSEVYLPEEIADLARLLTRGVEPFLYARVDLGQKLHGLTQGSDQLFVGYFVEGVGELLELPNLRLKPAYFVLSFPAILHNRRTIHHPGHPFGSPKSRARPDYGPDHCPDPGRSWRPG